MNIFTGPITYITILKKNKTRDVSMKKAVFLPQEWLGDYETMCYVQLILGALGTPTCAWRKASQKDFKETKLEMGLGKWVKKSKIPHAERQWHLFQLRRGQSSELEPNIRNDSGTDKKWSTSGLIPEGHYTSSSLHQHESLNVVGCST